MKKNLAWLFDIGDYTTQLWGLQYTIIRTPIKQAVSWKVRVFFFVAQLIPNMAFVATLRFEGVEMIQKTWMDGFFSDAPKGPMCPCWVGQLGYKRNLHHPYPLTRFPFLLSNTLGWMISWPRLDKISNTYSYCHLSNQKDIYVLQYNR